MAKIGVQTILRHAALFACVFYLMTARGERGVITGGPGARGIALRRLRNTHSGHRVVTTPK